MITKIAIKNFRSIRQQEIDGNWITVFVGSNDAGKSNVLRALNLFFNDVTDPGEELDFDQDYCNFGKLGKNKAREIEVKIHFELPSSYTREDYPSEISWTKRWRSDGLSYSKSSYVDGSAFPPRSKVPALLDRIRFTYVPAIKDKEFFADLQGSLYDVLASVAARPLRASAASFEKQLQEQLDGLLKSLQESFDAEATMRLPENLRQIFEALEISSNGIPLSRRGDGIKIRHIPKILEFVSKRQDQILNKGGVKFTHIWGFEEPENSVEMSACFKMAADLTRPIEENDNYQLLLTTHSPIFYKLPDSGPTDDPWVTTHFVQKDDQQTVIVRKAPGEVDEDMGLMPLVAPFVDDARAKLEELHGAIKTARDLAAQQIPTLFVEGASDHRVIGRAIEIFDPTLLAGIRIHDGAPGYGGAQAVASRSTAWLLEMRHRAVADRTRAVALFDDDQPGRDAKALVAADIVRLRIKPDSAFSYFKLPCPPIVREMRASGFTLPADLESFYTDDLWLLAEKRGWLEAVTDLETRLSPTLLRKVINEGAQPSLALTDEAKRRLECKFSDDGKAKAAKHIAALQADKAKAELKLFEPLVVSLRSHLIPN